MSGRYRQSAHVGYLIGKQGPLEADGDGVRCINGGGLWDPSITSPRRLPASLRGPGAPNLASPRADGTSLAEAGTLVEHQVHPRSCPSCRTKMEIRRWSGLTFEACKSHGIWVAGDDLGYYRQLLV